MSGLNHLDRLEAESIHILRETVAEAAHPVMLYSMGKDSAVMLHLARKAFYPGPLATVWSFVRLSTTVRRAPASSMMCLARVST